jgi:hypothetical protein
MAPISQTISTEISIGETFPSWGSECDICDIIISILFSFYYSFSFSIFSLQVKNPFKSSFTNDISMERKYDSEFRKKLVSKLEDFKSRDEMVDIYNLISDINFSSNTNGMFFNINDFSNGTIKSLVEYTQKKGKEKAAKKLVYKTYNNDEHRDLKNKDKVIINKMKS